MSKMTTTVTQRTGIDGRGQPGAAAAAPGRTVPPGGSAAAPAQPARAKGPGRLLMVGVFVLSALIGGGAAGLFLAMSEQQEAASGTDAGGADAAIATLAQGAADDDKAVAAKPEAVATSAAPVKDAVSDENAAAEDAGKAVASAVRDEKPAAPAAAGAGGNEVASAQAGADVEQLKVLTNQVVAMLGGMNEPQSKPAESAADAADVAELRDRLAKVVDAALAQGKTDAQIRQLVAEALGSVDEDKIPASLRDASGKIDLRKLLAAILPSERAVKANLDGETQAYFQQLAVEAGRTVVVKPARRAVGAGRTGKPQNVRTKKLKRVPGKKAVARTRTKSSPRRAPKGRFFIQNGKRYTIVRKGDTLSGIASAAYGDRSAYTSIVRANRGRIDANRLQPGTRILIPNLKSAKRQKRRKIRRQSGAPARKEILQAFRSNITGSKVTPAGAQATGYRRQVGAKGIKITNFRAGRKPVSGGPFKLYASAL